MERGAWRCRSASSSWRRATTSTLSDARAYIDAALALGVVNLGFKDVGLPRSALRELAQAIRAGGGRSFLEVVSLDRDSELASAAAAADFGVDWLLGGVRADEVAPIASAAGLRYAPFAGRSSAIPARWPARATRSSTAPAPSPRSTASTGSTCSPIAAPSIRPS